MVYLINNMNRILKFRIWNLNNKQWNVLNAGHYQLFPDGKILNLSMTGLVFQQFTGLKDKNEKEIYEGDILKIKVSGSLLIFDLGTYIASVEWGNCKWKLNILTEKNKHENFNPDFYEDSGREYEIIGNIFENPELLK